MHSSQLICGTPQLYYMYGKSSNSPQIFNSEVELASILYIINEDHAYELTEKETQGASNGG